MIKGKKNLLYIAIFSFMVVSGLRSQDGLQAQGIMGGTQDTQNATYLNATTLFNQPMQGFLTPTNSQLNTGAAFQGTLGALSSLGLNPGVSANGDITGCGLAAAISGIDTSDRSLVGQLKKLAEQKKNKKDKGKEGKATPTNSIPKQEVANCGESPTPPSVSENSCTDYVGEGEKSSHTTDRIEYQKPKELPPKEYKDDKKKLQEYVDFYKWKAKSCGGEELKKIKNVSKALTCELNALSSTVAQMGNSAQQLFQDNQKRYGEMVALENDLDQQIAKTQELLGGDKNSGKKGLIDLQNELHKIRADNLFSDEGKFKEAKNAIDLEQEQLKTDLIAKKNKYLTSCLSSDTSSSAMTTQTYTCVRPKMKTATGPDGKPMVSGEVARNRSGQVEITNAPCGPLEYVLNSDARRLLSNQSGDRVKNSQRRLDNFFTVTSVQQRILSNLQQQMSTKDVDGSNISANIDSEAQILSALESQLNRSIGLSDGTSYQASSSALQKLRAAVQSCSQTAQVSLQNYQKGTDYQAKSKGIQQKKEALVKEVQKNATLLNTTLNEALFLMTGNTAKRARMDSKCVDGKYESAESCYQQTKNLLINATSGNIFGDAGNSLQIPKGSKIGGFSVQCKNLEDCVQNLQHFKSDHDQRKKEVVSKRQEWVSQGNSAIQKQLSNIAKGLSAQQKIIKDGYGKLKDMLSALGVSGIPESLKTLSPKSLKQSDGPHGEKGPFESPSGNDMASILSGLAGEPLPDFADSGIQSAVDSAVKKSEEKKKDMDKEANDATKVLDKFLKLEKEIKDACGGKWADGQAAKSEDDDRFILNPSTCLNCRQLIAACQDQQDKDPKTNVAELNAKIIAQTAAILQSDKVTANEFANLQIVFGGKNPLCGKDDDQLKKCLDSCTATRKSGVNTEGNSGGTGQTLRIEEKQ